MALYSRGLPPRDIEAHIAGIYGVRIGRDLISRVTDAAMDDPRAWQQRPLDDVYPVVFLDALVLKISEGGTVQRRACYLALGVAVDGSRDPLGMWFQETEGAKFNAEDRDQARERITHVIARLEPVAPKVATLLEEAEEDLIAFYAFPREHWTKPRNTNPLERVNKEIGRRSDVVGIFPNDASVIRLAGALLSEQTTNGSSSAAPPRRVHSPDPRRWAVKKSSLEQQKQEVAELNAA